MAPQLLPASAAAFAPRATHVNVVLGSKVELWLTQVLKRIICSRRPLNSVAKHQKCLTELLSSTTAVWTLTSVMVPRFPNIKPNKDPNPSMEALLNYRIIHLEAYIVHVDMVLENEVAFKLTSQSIEALINYHKEVYSDYLFADMYSWAEIKIRIEELHKDFVHSINKFVYRTHVSALEGLHEDGSGELLSEKSQIVKMSILNLFRPLELPSYIIENIYPEVTSPNCVLSSEYGSQSNFYPAILETQKRETKKLSSPKNMSSYDLIQPYTCMELNDVEQISITSPFDQSQIVDEVFSSPSQADFLVPSFLYAQFEIPEQLFVSNTEYNNQSWDPCYNWF